NLQKRALLEQQGQEQTVALAMASDAVGLTAPGPGRDQLEQLVADQSRRVHARIIVVDRRGRLIADSAGTAFLGTPYATAGRPELPQALGLLGGPPAPAPRRAFSRTLPHELHARPVAEPQ